MTAKIAVYTIGAWPGQAEKLEEELCAAKMFAGKYSAETRLLQHAEKGKFTHLLVSDPNALDGPALKKLDELKIRVMNFKDASRLL